MLLIMLYCLIAILNFFIDTTFCRINICRKYEILQA